MLACWSSLLLVKGLDRFLIVYYLQNLVHVVCHQYQLLPMTFIILTHFSLQLLIRCVLQIHVTTEGLVRQLEQLHSPADAGQVTRVLIVKEVLKCCV